MDRLDIRAEKAVTDEKDPSPVAALISLLAGVWGFLLLLGTIPGVEFLLGIVLSVTALLCAALLYSWWRSRKLFCFVFLTVAAVCGYTTYASWDTMLEQAVSIADAFRAEASLSKEPVTEFALLSGAALSLLLFAMEVLLKSHILLYLLTTAFLLAAPFFGVRPTVGAVCLLLLFQVSFWAWQRGVRRQKRSLLSPARQFKVAGRSVLAIFLLLALAGALAVPLVANQSERLYGSVYAAEGYIRRRLAGRRGNDPVTGGRISRGNNYQRGVPHLELTASRQPAETLYLRGFGGGEYVGGDWVRSSDEAVFQKIAKKHGWEELLGDVTGNYYRMYFERNSESNGEAEPISLEIRHSSGNYGNAYVPYYGRRRAAGYYDGTMQRREGYIYDYFEQKDMRIDPDYKPGEEYDVYSFIQREYMEQIQEDYTAVPRDILPRLTALVEENPLADLDEITAFILYTLHSNAEYTLTPGWTTLRGDVAEDFLFERRRGYCEHFALAGTLLYRLYGVPARYCMGYRVEPSEFEPMELPENLPAAVTDAAGNLSVIEIKPSYQATVTDEDAHAWVEIFLPDYGWTPIEVTPSADGVEAVSYPGFGAAELNQIRAERGWDVTKPSLEREYPDAERAGGGVSVPDFLFDLKFDWNAHPDMAWTFSIFLIELLLLLALFADCRRFRRLRKAETADSLETFARLLELLHFAGLLTGCDGAEPDFAERLSGAVPGVSLPDAQRLVAAVNRAAFGASPPAEEENEFVRALYRRAAEHVYSGLARAKKPVFKWVKAYG